MSDLEEALYRVIAGAVGDDRGTEEIVREVFQTIRDYGFQVVPKKPTDAMWQAGTESLKRVLHSADGIYGEMLEAAPKVT